MSSLTLETAVVSDAAPDRPESGSLFLFNKNVTKRWRNDKHAWQRARGGARINEHHENLKVKGIEVLNACYVRAEESESFRRRAYWLLQPWIDKVSLRNNTYLGVRVRVRVKV